MATSAYNAALGAVFFWAPGVLTDLQTLGCDLYLHQQALDTSTPSGRAMFQMCGVFAEYERGMIRERVNAGLARARARGKKLGRRPVKPSVEARICCGSIASVLGCPLQVRSALNFGHHGAHARSGLGGLYRCRAWR
jgi:Resolvase, N terminal domain